MHLTSLFLLKISLDSSDDLLESSQSDKHTVVKVMIRNFPANIDTEIFFMKFLEKKVNQSVSLESQKILLSLREIFLRYV